MADYVSGAFASWVSQWAAEARRFNPNHGAAGSGHGGQFTSAGSGSGGKTAAKGAPKAKPAAKPKTAKKLPSVQPNGLGYTAAQWGHLQQLEARHAAGKKLTAHELHLLHVAHEKHEAHLAAGKAAAGKNATRRPAGGHLSAPKAAGPAAGKATPRKVPANNTNKYFAGHPVKGA